jgi:hypothetical protein
MPRAITQIPSCRDASNVRMHARSALMQHPAHHAIFPIIYMKWHALFNALIRCTTRHQRIHAISVISLIAKYAQAILNARNVCLNFIWSMHLPVRKAALLAISQLMESVYSMKLILLTAQMDITCFQLMEH